MNDYYSVRIDASPCSADITDLAAAFLADAGFESFEPDSHGLTAFVSAALGNGEQLAAEALADFPISSVLKISAELVAGKDWNEEWEKHYFKPIVIGERCVVHSTFHTDVPKGEYDIVIDPKMAFGTGHHDTTSQMATLILDSDFSGKSVIDMGTGTGILGILAAMRGADSVCGIEIDEPAYKNALENVALNNVAMRLIHSDASALQNCGKADFLFANINRNIILADIDRYADALLPDGSMFLSGFYDADVPMILEAAKKYNLTLKRKLTSRSGWTALELHKNLPQ